MQYNKNQFNKVKDKKVMKKVKKQWVVVSVATLAALGTTVYSFSGHDAHADTNPSSNQGNNNSQNNNNQQTNTSQDKGNTSGSQSANVSLTPASTTKSTGNTNSSGSVSSSSSTQQAAASSSNGSSNPNPVVTISSSSNGQAPSFNNNDDSATYSQQIQQGYQDAYNGKGNNSVNLTGQAVNYYNAGYNGAIAAMNAYNQTTNGYGTGTQDYTYYGNTPVRRNDNGTTANASLAVPSGTPSAAAVASLQSSDPVSGATMSAQAIIDGTPQSYATSDSPYRGGANNPIEATSSVNKYETTLLNKLNNANNVSVQLPNNTITVPDQNNSMITNSGQVYANYSGLYKAFQTGVNWTLAQQGINDAESGKWTGISKGTTTNTDFYLQSNTQPTTNPYDQAYRGAKTAISATFTNDNYNGNSSIQAKIASSNTDYYTLGYNDVVTKSQSGTAFVLNGQQFYSVLTGLSNSISNSGGTISSNVNNIRLVGDAGLTGNSASAFTNTTITTNLPSLIVDGQNHLMDFNGMNYAISGSSFKDLYLKNFQTLYGSNYYGPFQLSGSGSIHYSNLNYIGPQLLSAYGNDVFFSGNVNILNPYDINTNNGVVTYNYNNNNNYTPYQRNGDTIQGGGNQENLEVNNFVLEDGAHYFGSVSPDKGGTNIIAKGNFTLGQNSKMTLLTRDSHGNAEGAYDSANYGIYLSSGGANNNPSLNVLKNAVLNLIGGQSTYANYIGSGIVTDGGVNSTINVDGGTINYEGANGVPGYYGQVFDFKGSTTINVINGGLVKVLLANAPSSSNSANYYNDGGSPSKQITFGGLINNNNAGNPQTANFNVANGGNLIVGLYDNGGGYVIPYFGNLNMNSVGPDNAVFLTNNSTKAFQTNSGSNGQTYSGSITAYNVAVTTAGSTTPTAFYKFQLNSSSQTFTGVRSDGVYVTGSISDSHKLIIANLPSVQFVGNLQTSLDNQGNTVVTANAKISNYSGNYSRIYYGVGYSNTNPSGNFNSLTNYTTNGGVKNGTPNLADNNTYYAYYNVPSNYDGSIIPITFTIPKSVIANPAYVGMRLKYGLASVTNVLGSNGSTTNIEGYSLNNGQLVQDSGGSFQIGTSDLTKQTLGVTDALTDLVNNNTSAKSSRDFNTQTNTDYSVSYASAKTGYQAFNVTNPLSDDQVRQSSDYINSPNPNAYIQGYHRALYDAGVRDGRNGIVTQSLSSMPDYQAGMNQYNNAYNTALAPTYLGLDTNTITTSANLPTTYLGAPATGTSAGINDATGASYFVQDERNGTINGSKRSSITDSNIEAAYIDAETGYEIAVNNGQLSANASRAQQAGYQYAKSLIAGAMSSQMPTQVNPSAGIYNLLVAQDGFNAAQQAVKQAVSNLFASGNTEYKVNSHDALSDDSYIGDRTVYKSIKYGYYQGYNKQSDVNLVNQVNTKLDQIEEVGYIKYVQPAAYDAGSQSFNNNGSSTPTAPFNNSNIGQQSYTSGYNDAQTAFNQGQTDGLTNVKNSINVSNQPSSVPSAYTNNNVQTSYQTGYKGAVDGYKDGVAITTGGTPNANNNQGTANNTYATSYENGNSQGKQQAGANDYVNNNVNQSLKASDNDYSKGVDTAAQGHAAGYSQAQSQPGNQNITTNNTDKTYVTGFNSGVSDERSDAQKLNDMGAFIQGANDYITNKQQASTSGKSLYAIAYYQQGYNTAQRGLQDARDGKEKTLPIFQSPSDKNNNTYVNSQTIIDQFTAELQSAYNAGYSAFNNGSSQNDVTTGFSDSNNALANSQIALSANDSNKSVAYNVAADIFNSSLATLQGNTYTHQQSTNGTMYTDLQSWFDTKAQADYQNGENVAKKTTVAPTTSNPANQNYFGIVQAGFNDLTNGYNGATGTSINTKSQGYTNGQIQKQQLNTGISTAINSVKNNAPSDPDQLDAYKGTIAGYNDRATGSITGSSSINSTYDKVFVDAYNKAYSDGANLANEALQQLSQNQSATDATLNADGAKNAAYTAAYNQVMDGYHFVLGMATGSTPTSNANYKQGQTVGYTFINDYNAAEAKSNPKVSDNPSSQTYHGVVDALNNASANGTIPTITSSSNGTLYIDGYNRAVADINKASADAVADFDNGRQPNPSQETTAAIQAGYTQAYQALTTGFKQGLSNPNSSAPSNTNAAAGFANGQATAKGYTDAITDFNNGSNNPNANTEPGYADTMNALLDAQKKQRNNNNTTTVYGLAYSQALGANDGLTAVKNNSSTSDIPTNVPSTVNPFAYQDGYQGSVDGYKDGSASTEGTSTNNSAAQANNPIYQNAYKQGNTAGRLQAGANDYTNGTVSQNEQQQDKNYATGVTIAANGYQDGASGVTKQGQDKPYTTGNTQGIQAADGVKQAQALNSTDNGLSGDSKSAYYGVKDAYAYVANPNIPSTQLPSYGVSGINTQSNAYQAARKYYEAQALSDEAQGVATFQASQDNTYDTTSANATVDTKAMSNGYNQAQKGYNASTTNTFDTTNNSASYKAGNTMFNDIVAGINDAKANPTLGANYTGSAVRVAAYDGTAGAFNDVLKNTPNASATPLSRDANQSKAYVDAYNRSRDIAIQDGANGALAYVKGQNQATGNDADSQAFNYGYGRAQTGFSDSKTIQSPQASDSAYMTGYNAYQSELLGNTDAKSGNQNNFNNAIDKNSYNDALNAYTAAYTDLSINPDNTNNPNMTGKSPAYADAYSVAKSYLQGQYQQGVSQFASGYSSGTGYTAVGSTAQAIQMLKKGYTDALQGYKDALSGEQAATTITTSGAQSGFQEGQQLLGAVNDVANNGKLTNTGGDPIYSLAFTAARKAKDAVDSNPDVSNVVPASNPNASNNVYASAYTNAVNAIQTNYQNGVQQYLSSQAEPANPTTEYDMGYKDAKQSFEDAIVRGQSSSTKKTNEAINAFNEGQKALQGYNDAVSTGQINYPSGTDQNQIDANSGASQALTDISNGLANNDSAYTSSSNAFKLAYAKVKQAAQTAYDKGASGYVNGDNNTTATDPISKVQSAGYVAAKQGHDLQQAGQTLTDAQKNNSALNTGFNDSKSGNEGLAAAGSNTTPDMTKWTQPQKDGYQGTVDAYANGQSDGQMPDLTGKSQAYKDAYTTSYNDAKQKATQGANAALTGQPVDQTGWTQKQKDAYATGATNANNAYKQNQDNVNATNPYSAGSDGSESFDGAKAGFSDGTNGGQTSLDGKSDVFKAAYNKAQQEAKQNAQAGIDEFTANKSNTASSTATDAKNVAHNDGYTQAQAGYNGQTGPGINTNDPAYKAGQQLRNDENTGVSAAQQATGSDDKSFTPSNASQKAAYDAALAGITAGANNNNNGQSVPEGDSAQAKAYTDAYNQAHALGMQKAADGANAFNAGQSDTSDKSLAGQAQSQGYKDAQSGHDAAVKNQTLTEAQKNNPSFMAGYNAAESARTGLSDIEKGATTPTSHVDDNAYKQAQQAYKDASDSIADNPDNPAPTTNTSPAYQEIYKQAQADLKNNYDAGKQQFMDAQSSANTSGASSDQGKGRISQGYADAQAGFNAAINGQTITNPNDAQKAGMDAVKTVTDTVKASVDGSYKNSSDPVAQAANSATQSAHNDLLNDPDHADVSTDPSIANNPVKAAAYKQAQEQYKANYDAGTNAYLNNTIEPSDDLGKKGYQEANDGFTAGFSGQTSIANQHSAAQSGLSAGEQALAGYNNALSLKDENANAPQVEKDGNDGAKQAFADAKNGTSMSASDLAKEPVAFQAAYNKAKEIAQKAITDGATAFASGEVRPTVTDAITDAQAKAYDDARSGYDAAKTGATLTQAQKDNPSFMTGIKAYQDAQSGRTLFNEGKELPGDATTAEKLAYNATKDAYTAGASDQPQRSDLNQQPGIYQDEYSDSYADAQQKAQAGASEAFGNSASKVDQSTWTQAQKDAYNTGKANAEAGFDKTKQDVTAQNNYPTGSNSGEAFDGAKAGFSDGKSGATTDLTNKTQTFINAYNAAKQEAQDAAKAGADQFNAQQDDSADANAKDALSVAHVNGFTQAQNGYNAQNNNTVDNGNKDTSYQSGVQTAKDVAKGSADALTDPSKKNSYNSGSAAQDAAYKATVNGYLDGSNGNNDNATTTDSAQAKAYNDAYQAAKQKGSDAAGAGAKSYIDGSDKPTGSSAESLAQQKGYQDATDGYNAATNKDATVPTNATAAYKAGFNANKSGQAGINDIENGTTTENVVDTPSYNKARKAYDDASKAISANPDSPATASDSSKVYQTAYTKAINDLKQNYQDGTNQFVNGSNSADTSGAKSNQAKTQIEQGYADVQRGFNDKIDGTTTNNANDTTQKGADMAQKVIDSVNGVATDNVSSSNDSIVQTANSAAGQAKQDLQNDPDHSTTSDDASIQNNPIKSAAYKVAVNQMHQQYADGSGSYLNNQAEPSTDLGKQGYTDAQAGFAAGFNGTSVPNEHSATKAGQTAGKSALAGYQEALSNKKDTSGDAMQQQANAAALQAFDDAKNLKTTDISKEPVVAYQLAYQKAQQDAAAATTSGATAFANGETRPTGDDALSQVKQAAYDYAKSGYEAARDGKITDDDKKNPSFMSGVDAYNQSIKGHDAYVNGEQLPGDASAAERAGYTAAQDAYSSGKNDNDKPSDLGSKPEAYQDVYNNAYADAKAKATIGASEAFNNTTPVSQDGWTQAQKTAYAAGKQNATAAYNDTKSDNTKANPNVSGTDAAQAFDGAKAGFTAGAKGIKPDDLNSQSATYKAAFNSAYDEAQSQSAQAQRDFAAGKSDQSTASNGSLNQAYKSAYAENKQGYNDQKDGKVNNDNKDINYLQGIENAKQLANGTNDATTNPSNNGNEYKSTPAQEAAYQATLNGYKDGANGNSDNQTPTDARQSVVYNDAYAAAKQQAQKDAATGASDFNKGLDKSIGTDSHSIAQAKGYQDASDGYSLAKGTPSAATPSGATDAYIAGYNAYHSSQAGLSDAENNTATNHVDNDAYAKAQKAYTDASNAIAANPDKPQTSQYKDPAYVDAYNKAVSDLQTNYQTGQQQFDSGKNVADTTGVTSQQAKDRLAQGYADTKEGFDSIVNNTPISNPNAAQKDGIKSAKTVQDAVSGIVNSNTDSNNQDPVYTSATEAAQQAKADLIDNPGHSTNSDDSTIQNNPIKKAAYAQAIQAMQVQYNEGANAFVSNQPEPSDKLGQDGYSDAQQGFNTGFAGTKVADNADSGIQTGNKYGLSALNGYQDAYNGVSNSNTGDAPRDDANKAAQQAFDDAKTGNVTDLSNKSLAYQSAYKKAQGDAKQALIQGAQIFADGNASPAVTNAPSGVAAKAYSDAVAGYKAAQAGGNYTDEQKANPQFMVGVNAYNEMVSGRQLFTSGGQLTGNESASEKAGYLAAQAAFAAGKNDEPKDSTLANKSVQYQDAYNNAYENAKQIANSGANDAYATNPTTDTSKLSSTELDAYNAGKQNAQTAYNAIKGDTTTTNNNIVDSDAYNSFEGAKAGFAAGKTGNDTSLDGKSTAYINAYKSAKNEAAQAATAGLAEFNGGKADTATNSNDALNVAHKNAFDQATAGYNAQVNGQINQNNNDKSYQAGVQTANDMQTGYNDALTNPNRAVYNGPAAQVAAYHATVNGFHDGSYGTNNSTPTDSSQAKVYADAYTKAVSAGQTAALAGATTYNSGSAKSDDNSATGKAAQKGYDDAKQGHDDAINNAQVPNNPSAAYQSGEQAVTDGKSGANDFTGQKDANANYTSGNTNVQTGHDGAKDGYLDAVQGNTKKSFDTSSNKTQAYQDQYSAEYDKALAKASLGAQNQFTNNNQDMTNWTQADKNAYKAGQASASQGYNEARQKPDDATHTGNTNVDESFKGAAAAFNDVKNGEEGQNGTSDASPVYQDAYKVALNAAKQVANNGATSFGNNQDLAAQVAKLGSNQADKNAFTKGYNDAQAAYAQAQQTPSQASPYATGTNSNLVFEAAQNAFSDVKNGEAGAQANKSSDPAYVAAYQRALNEVQPVATNGANGFSNGVNLQQQLESFGNNQAQKDAYTKGYNDAQTAYGEALQNANDNADHNTSSNGDETYRGAAAALLDVKNGTAGQNATAEQSAPYQAAYAKALAQAKAQSNAGATAFGNSTDLNSALGQFGNNQALSDTFAKGYNDASAGYSDAQADANMSSTHATNGDKDEVYRGAADAFNAVSRGDNPTPDESQTNAAYLAAFSRAKAQALQIAKEAAIGFNQGTTQQDLLSAQGDNKALQNAVSRGYTDAQNAYAQAEANPDTTGHQIDSNADKTFHGASLAFNDQKEGQEGANRPANTDSVAQSAYDKALSYAQGIAKNGSSAFLNGTKLSTALATLGSNQADKDAFEKGYEDAQTAYAQAQQNPSNTSPYAANTNSDYVFKAAVNAINDVKNNTVGNTANAINDKVYQNAYQRALNDAQPQATNGAIGFGNGVDLNTALNKLGNNQADKAAYTRGYNNAQEAYNQALQNANDAANHTSTSNSDEAYRGAAEALLNAKNGKQDVPAASSESDVYKASYAKAMRQAIDVTKLAGVAYLTGNKLDASLSQYSDNQAIKDVFTKGYDDAQSGIAQMKQNATKLSDHTEDNNLDISYRGAAYAIQDFNDNTPNAHQNFSDDSVYQAAYELALQFLKDSANNGVKAYTQGETEDTAVKNYSVGDSDITSIQYGYNQAKAGHSDGQANNATPKSNDPYYQAGFQYAQDTQSGFKNAASSSFIGNAKNGGSAQDDAYNGSLDGYRDGGSNSKVDLTGKSLAYQDAYAQAVQAKLVQINQDNIDAMKQTQKDIPVGDNYYKVNYKFFRVRSEKGALIHTSDKFTDKNWVIKLQKGDRIRVEKIVQYRGTTRLYIGNGEYVTGNKEFVIDDKSAQKLEGRIQARKDLSSGKALPKGLFSRSKQYIEGYVTEYYSVKKHSKVARTKKVKSTKPVTTKHVKKNAGYYRNNKITYRVTSASGVKVHTNAKFTKNNWVMTLQSGDLIKVNKVVEYRGITRFFIGNGEYITSNKGLLAEEKSIAKKPTAKKDKSTTKPTKSNIHKPGKEVQVTKKPTKTNKQKVKVDSDKTKSQNDKKVPVTAINTEGKYYTKNYKTFRVINKAGVQVHTNVKFTDDNWIITLQAGDRIKVEKIVNYYGATRFYIGHGEYVTGNKAFVKKDN